MINDKLVFPVTITKTISHTFNVLARNEDEAADIINEMYMDCDRRMEDYFEDDSLGDYGHHIDVDEFDAYATPEIDENGWIE